MNRAVLSNRSVGINRTSNTFNNFGGTRNAVLGGNRFGGSYAGPGWLHGRWGGGGYGNGWGGRGYGNGWGYGNG